MHWRSGDPKALYHYLQEVGGQQQAFLKRMW